MRFEGLSGRHGGGGLFLSVSLSIKRGEGGHVDDDDDDDNDGGGYVRESGEALGQNGNKSSMVEAAATVVCEEGETDQLVQRSRVKGTSSDVMNVTKHLWAGVVAAMVSRFVF